ncbi:MAG: SAM-dependent chlorinase/fluorinase [Cytophagales bacterium]|nr:SAM-dependent chlorinase/fluorinase [Cytophagales bacterium]
MPLITFLSDFGDKDHYIAAVKAKIYSSIPNASIVDISHSVEAWNIAYGAYILHAVFREFPENTIHIVSINSLDQREDKFISIKLENHYFIGADNGLFSLISDKKPDIIVELSSSPLITPSPPESEKRGTGETESSKTKRFTDSPIHRLTDSVRNSGERDLGLAASTAFPEKDIFAPAAIILANEGNIRDLGQKIKSMKQMLNRQLKVTKDQLSGQVIHIDSYGNLVTNIDVNTFERCKKGRKYKIAFGSEIIENISKVYNQVEGGECVCLFNSNALLEIAFNKWNASEALYLTYDSVVTVTFYTK